MSRERAAYIDRAACMRNTMGRGIHGVGLMGGGTPGGELMGMENSISGNMHTRPWPGG